MTAPEVSIVIVSWNATEALKACLTSIRDHLNEVNHEVIVIDNHGEDNPQPMIDRHFPDTRFVRNPRNEGFAVANNQGFAMACGRLVLILNPDTVLRPGAVQRMIQVLDHNPKVGMVGPRVLEMDGSPVRACNRRAASLLSLAWGLFLTDKAFHWLMKKTFGRVWLRFADRRFEHTAAVACIQGSCMLLRRVDLEALGGFDERIPMYLDDGDLCEAVRQSGRLVWYQADAEVLHHGGRSVSAMTNPRMSSMVGCLAIDAWFLKHRSRGHVAAWHLMLFISSLIFLAADVVLWPLLRAKAPDFIPNYWEKHVQCLRYSLTFSFKTKALPEHWPRSLRGFYSAADDD